MEQYEVFASEEEILREAPKCGDEKKVFLWKRIFPS